MSATSCSHHQTDQSKIDRINNRLTVLPGSSQVVTDGEQLLQQAGGANA
jgi:hypothetical protein